MKDPCCQHGHCRGQQQLHKSTKKDNFTDVEEVIKRKFQANCKHQQNYPDLSHHLNVFR